MVKTPAEELPDKANPIVVGGGPVGLYAAYTIAGGGWEATIYEEHEEIGLPEHCPGHVSLRGLKLLNLHLPDKVIENVIRGARFFSPSNHLLEVDMKTPFTATLNRVAFDKWLAESSSRRGVNIVTGRRVRSLYLKEGGMVEAVTILGGGGVERRETGIVVDAEGFPPILPRQVDGKADITPHYVNGVQMRVEEAADLDQDFVEVYFGEKYAPGFFSWIIPLRDGSAKVGLAARGWNPRDLIERFVRKHPVASKKLKAKSWRPSFHPIPLGGPSRRTSYNGLVVVGDAASQVKPTTGGGLVTGLLCAREAGNTVVEAIQDGCVNHAALERYDRGWRRWLEADFKAMRIARRLLDRVPEGVLDRVFLLLKDVDLADYIGGGVDLDFQGDMLLKPLKSPLETVRLAVQSALKLLP